jgi:molybdate-binding protein/DNA-binding transcriptional regulator YhcF (GntR family)
MRQSAHPLAVALRASSTQPPSAQIIGYILAGIRSGQLTPGTRLPAVRSLAVDLNLNVNTVARAYRDLARTGLLATRRGGGTRVADAAERRLRLVSRLQLQQVADDTLARVETRGLDAQALPAAVARAARRALPGPSAAPEPALAGTLRFVGSHDLSLDLLAARLAMRRPAVHLITDFRGSLGGLEALARAQADLAGCHLFDQQTGDYNAPFVRRLIPNRAVVLITLVSRRQGFMLRPGLRPPRKLAVETIARRGWRVVNRPPGSGTRVLFDHLLAQAHVPTRAIRGYLHEVSTHSAVADAVAAGWADLGLGIEAAARTHGLAFVPVATEPYELAVVAERLRDPAVRALLQVLRSRVLARLVMALGGYDTGQAGTLRRVA